MRLTSDASHDGAPGGRANRSPRRSRSRRCWFAGCRTANLPLYFVGPEADSVALYEQLFAHCKGVYFRCLDEFGDPVVYPAPPQCLQQVGFEHEDALFPNDHRVFEGFDLLREFFVFPRKFLGCNLTGLGRGAVRS